MLCSNRPENFGPSSHLSSSLPTTCFIDVILIPLPIWIALFLLPLLLVLGIHHRKTAFNPSTAHLRSRRKTACLYTTILTIYYLLIIANIVMVTLEIVRLALLQSGIGLIPFAYVGLILGGLLFSTEGLKGRIRGWQIINMVVWIGGIVMSVVQTIGLVQQLGIHGRKESKYPVVDQVTDVAVMAGVYAVIAGLEIVLRVWCAKRRAEALMEGRGDMESFQFRGKGRGLSESPAIGFEEAERSGI